MVLPVRGNPAKRTRYAMAKDIGNRRRKPSYEREEDMTREAMQEALDALESVLYEVEEKWFDSYDLKKAIASLRKALSQPSPEWHDMPTCAGVWICDEASDLKYEWRVQSVTWPLHSLLLGEGERWYGPIPEDEGAKKCAESK